MKRSFVLLLTALLALSLLAGCGGMAPVVLVGQSTAQESGALAELVPAVPAAAELEEGFFLPVAACQPGTAGASLKLAQAACTAFASAASWRVFDQKPALLRQNLQQAWDELDREQQAAFVANFGSVCGLLFDCMDNWAANRPLFEDAGAAETMDRLLADRLVRADWLALASYTLTLEREKSGLSTTIILAPPGMVGPTPTPNIGTIEIIAPPTPSPTPTPKPDNVKVFFFEDEKEEITEKVGEAVKLKAVAYPMDEFAEAKFTWSVNDESVLRLTMSEDTKECEILCLKHQPGGVTLTVECNGVARQVRIYTKN